MNFSLTIGKPTEKVLRSSIGTSLEGEEEIFLLCCSTVRKEKERAILQRFTWNIDSGLENIQTACQQGRIKNPGVAEHRIGRLLQRNSRAASLFDIQVKSEDRGKQMLTRCNRQERLGRANLSEGSYLLRFNISDWSAEELWRASIHLTYVEAAFRIQKSDLGLRPIWHQKEKSVRAHILVCFLAWGLWKCFPQMCKQNGLGHEPRKIIDEIKRVKLTGIILPPKKGVEIKLQCVSKPDAHQKIL